jgi:hypothetical protein
MYEDKDCWAVFRTFGKGPLNLLMKTFLLPCAIVLATTLFAQENTINKSDSTSAAPMRQNQIKPGDLNLIKVPEGFVVSDYFHGYIDFINRSAIYVYELDSINPEFAMEGSSESFIKQSGAQYLGSEEILSDKGVKGYCVKSSFTSKEKDYLRITVYAGNFDNTFILDIVLPKSSSDEYVRSVENCFNSINYQR